MIIPPSDFKEIEVELTNVFLDPNNPRFMSERDVITPDNRIGDVSVQQISLDRMRAFGIDVLQESIMRVGFLQVDKVVLRPLVSGKFVVVEGNRRIAALKMVIKAVNKGEINLEKDVLETIEKDDPSYYQIKQTVAVIQQSNLDFLQFKIDLDENLLAHDGLEKQIKGISKELSQSKSEEVRSLIAQRDQLLIEIGAAENKKDNFQKQLEDQKRALDNVCKLIEDKDKHTNIKANLEKQKSVADRCVLAFSSVLNNLSDVRRKAIAKHATDVFRMLTNKPEEYDRIEIDEQFNVSVMDKQDNIVHRVALSTGERLVVALSFILGLKQASEKTAPLVLDTFFAHLDEEHFGNIVKALPDFADQVILILTKLEYRNLKEMAPESFFGHIFQTLQVTRNKPELRSEIGVCDN